MMNFKSTRGAALALSLAALLAAGGCADMSPTGYNVNTAQQAQYVQYGTVVDAQAVRINESTTPGLGAVAGAVIGGLAGASIGHGLGSALGAAGGVVAGGLAGNAIQNGVSTKNGVQLTVRLDNGQSVAVSQVSNEYFAPGDRVRVLTGNDGRVRVTH
jgi:outer membrane lipoprotein SlyB